MIRKSTSLLVLLFCSIGLYSQTIRTDVTVLGGTAAGIAAGIQAARSGVKSLVLEDGKSLSAEFSPADLIHLERIRDHYLFKSEADSGKKNTVQTKRIQPEESAKLLKNMTDTVKRLTVMLNSPVKKIEKDGKGWEIRLQNGRTIKTDVIIDAAKSGSLSALLKVEPQKTIIQVNNWINTPASMPRLFRTSVAYGRSEKNNISTSFLVPAGTMMPAGVENIFLVPQSTNQVYPETMLSGQAAGAAAAYCAYFKTTSKNLNVRVTQGELLAYGSRLIPYQDIEFADRHAISLQHTGLAGILKAKLIANTGSFIFDTLGTVSSEELRLPMKEFYSRSQLWFADHKKDSLSIGETINLIMFTATRGEELRREIEAGWNSSFKFSTPYDPTRAINRREFAVLTDKYLQPFNRRIDLSGNLLN